MPAGDQQRCESETTHHWSVTRKFACMVALAWSCDGSAVVPDADPNDLDGDGIPNADDICPQRFDTAPEHDEDGDGLGDACDNCPTIDNTDQSDVGEGELQFPDGVGDACDPRSSRAGDKLDKLFTFVTDPASAFTGSGWSAASDRAVADGDARWTGVRNAPGDGVAAEIRVPVLTWTAAVGDVTVAVDGDGAVTGLTCGLVHDSDGDGFDEVVASVVRGERQSRSLGTPLLGEVTIRATRLISFDRVGTLLCRVTHQGTPHELQLTTEDGGTGLYTMAAHGAHAEVTSLVVYTAPFNHGGP